MKGYPEVEISSVSELISEIQIIRRRKQTIFLWFRAQSSADWSLEPSIFRGAEVKAEKYFTAEKLVSQRGLQRFASFFPNIGEREYVEWLTALQHYDVPTRLLDWTESLSVCLHFLRKKKSRRPAVFVLDPIRLNFLSTNSRRLPVNGVLGFSSDLIKARAREAFEDLGENTVSSNAAGPLAFLPRHIDNRMIVQNACFTISGKEMPALDKFIESFPPATRRSARQTLTKFVIPESKVADFMREVDEIAPSYQSMMPDLVGCSREVQLDKVELEAKI